MIIYLYALIGIYIEKKEIRIVSEHIDERNTAIKKKSPINKRKMKERTKIDRILLCTCNKMLNTRHQHKGDGELCAHRFSTRGKGAYK